MDMVIVETHGRASLQKKAVRLYKKWAVRLYKKWAERLYGKRESSGNALKQHRHK